MFNSTYSQESRHRIVSKFCWKLSLDALRIKQNINSCIFKRINNPDKTEILLAGNSINEDRTEPRLDRTALSLKTQGCSLAALLDLVLILDSQDMAAARSCLSADLWLIHQLSSHYYPCLITSRLNNCNVLSGGLLEDSLEISAEENAIAVDYRQAWGIVRTSYQCCTICISGPSSNFWSGLNNLGSSYLKPFPCMFSPGLDAIDQGQGPSAMHVECIAGGGSSSPQTKHPQICSKDLPLLFSFWQNSII